MSAALASLECSRGFMVFEKIMRPSFPGRYRGSGAAPVLAKTSRHLVSNALNEDPVEFISLRGEPHRSLTQAKKKVEIAGRKKLFLA
jgi:hypothetical protein